MRNCIIAQSGGPTVAINASLAGVLRRNEISHQFDTIYGALNGITGILNDRLLNLTEKVQADTDFIEKLKVTPAMYLGSCRYKLPTIESDEHTYRRIFQYFEDKEIDTFFYIGGNDSMDTVLKLSDFAQKIGSTVKVIGIPKTIDNDLCHTDHTPGFGSAAKYIASTVREIAHDTFIYAIKSVTIVEIMGRDAGWLTAAAALARTDYSAAPQLIYLPEVAFDKDQCIADVRDLLTKTNNVIIAISEGIRDKNGKYISATESGNDTFGHSQLSGAGKTLEYILKDALQVKVRSVEVNVLQRCASHLASLTDLNESMALGEKACELSAEGASGVMVTVERTSNTPYTVEIGSFDIHNIANEVRNVPKTWINQKGNDVTAEMLTYLRPLVLGEPSVTYTDGIPSYLNISHLLPEHQ